MDEKPKHEELPIDIVHEILLRLPVKKLLMFKLVSKSWYSLISHTCFQQHHYRRHSQQDPLLLFTRYEFNTTHKKHMLHLSTYNTIQESPISSFSIGVTQRYSSYLMALSCQGLVCICEILSRNILLCNPSTREIIRLPPTIQFVDNFGFGYAASAKEFKVVSFSSGSNPRCQVFRLGSCGWREARNPPPKYQSILSSPFVHGAIHLLLDQYDEADGIYAFDIETEEYKNIPLPEHYYHTVKAKQNSMDVVLKELGGFLGLVFSFDTSMDLWLLKDYESRKWVKECTIDLTSLPYDVWGRALVAMGNGHILLSIAKLGSADWSLYFYDPQDKTVKQTVKQMTGGEYQTALYTESLLPLGRNRSPDNSATELVFEELSEIAETANYDLSRPGPSNSDPMVAN